MITSINLKEVDNNFKKLTGINQVLELSLGDMEELAHGLKKCTFTCISRNDNIQMYEKTGEKIINGLYKVFSDNNYNNNAKFLPIEYRSDCEFKQKRLIIDYIAGMMDSFAITTYKKFYGEKSLDEKYFNI